MAFALAAAFIALSAQAEEASALTADISGRALVVDGDTIEIAGTRIRLEGIDAPETAQTCLRRSMEPWPCGMTATRTLEHLIGDRRVDCESRGRDKYQRMIGLCRIDGRDLNEAMVRAGMAWAFVKYSTSYVDAEAAARETGAGIWQGQSQPAWLYRETRWKTAESSASEAPAGCVIKGNITGNGQIYFVPWSSWYARVKVEPAKGERWFCSEAEAEKAGWRAALSH